MNKPIALIIVAVVVILGGLIWWKNSPKNSAPPQSNTDGIVLYFGDTCPHCKVVAQYIQDNKIKEKVNFTEKEVYNDAKNSKELVERAKTCGLATDSIGVPFLWDGQKCILGQDDVINFFKQKAGI